MPYFEIREGSPEGEVVSTHEEATLVARGFRTYRAAIVEGFQAMDKDGNVIEYLSVDHRKGLEFTDSGICITGSVLYHKEPRNGDLNNFYSNEECKPGGPAETHAWVVTFPGAVQA